MNLIFQQFAMPIEEGGYGFELLDYAIPYFLQDFAFAYKGNEIVELSNATT